MDLARGQEGGRAMAGGGKRSGGKAAGAASGGPGFVHLHLHTEYSLLDGGNRVDRLVDRVKELGMDAVAVTDHGNIHGAVQFYEKARDAGIKPILGVEAYVAPGDRTDRTYTGVGDGGYHLVLLAENQRGWENLLYLCSEAYLTGFYFKPRIDRGLLESHHAGLIAINGHLGSEIGEHLLSYERTKDESYWARAVESAQWHARVFADEGTGPRFFVEMQHHIVEQNSINPHLIRLARETGLPLVCDNDSHFLRAEDHDAHDTLICISLGKVKNDPERLRYTPELYVKSPEEMAELFEREWPEVAGEALGNTRAIAERCSVELAVGANHAPVVDVKSPAKKDRPRVGDDRFGGDLSAWHRAFCAGFELRAFDAGGGSGKTATELKEDCDKALRELCEAGMVWRYGTEILSHRHELIEGTDEADAARGGAKDADAFDKWARLNRELRILADKLISAYFLIVWDFVNWGRQQGIPSNARGSGVGTMVGFVLGLSNACPVRYGLLFERFTDPDRSEYPDIDIDLCQDGRGAVIEYVRRKYGEKNVAQIITFGTLKPRAAVRDVCRVLEVPLRDADALAKLIPEAPAMTFKRAFEEEPELKKRYDSDETVRRVIDTARVIEGQARHCGVHAAGVVLANRPLHEIVPLYKQAGAEAHEVVTQWDGPTCEKMGLLKMDFLGLRTISVIERCRSLIREGLDEEAIWEAVGREYRGGKGDGRPHPLDLDRLTYDDQRVFDLFRRADTTGVFQFESGGMRRLLMDMKPDRLEDLIAANALFRPGPMDLIPDYNRRKHGTEPVPRVHEIVDRFTAETYGVMVYQEQVMQIVHELGGIPLRAAYSLIKAISKKKKSVIDAERPKFVEGAARKGLANADAENLYELILKFAGYGFNKSHSTGYAIVAYQTAYLKTYFPRQYMAAFLTYESQAQKVSDWTPYLEDCKHTRAIDPKTGEVVSAGIEVRPPDVNLSKADFAVVFGKKEKRSAATGHIRFGLKALKGAGGKAIEAIIGEREGGGEAGDRESRKKPYSSLFDFCERVPSGAVNKATIEALIKSGSFDALHGRDKRAAMCATIDAAVSAGQRAAADKAAGQAQLFGGGAVVDAAPEATLEKAEPWSEAETLRQEKETLGFYVSSHPLEQWSAWSGAFTNATLAELKDKPQDAKVIVAALVQSVRTIVVKQGRSAGQRMAILTLEDTTATADAVLFADRYAKYGHLLEDSDKADAPKFVLGRLDLSRGDPQIIVDQLAPIEGVPVEKGTLRLCVRAQRLNGSAEGSLSRVRELIESFAPIANGKGSRSGARSVGGGVAEPVPVDLVLETEDAWVMLKPEQPMRVRLDPDLVGGMREVLGDGCAKLIGGVTVVVEERKKLTKRGG
ncbi:MAG: DNA polymerase III subunit alpha [Phycisphaerales bacterium JB037]